MSGHAIQSYEESDGMFGKSKYPYQSVWMAHWMQTSCRSSTQLHNFPSLQREIKEDRNDTRHNPFLGRLMRASTTSESTEESKQVPGMIAPDIMTKSLKTSPEVSRSKGLNCEPFPISSLSRNNKTVSAMETDHILFNAGEASSASCKDLTGNQESDCRWVKRLKLSTADSLGKGTKSSKVGEVLFPEKVKNFFSKIIKRDGTGSDKAAAILREGESAFKDLKKEDQEMALSHSWIRRLCKDRSPLLQKQHGVDEFPKDRHPSIAAMALMGKTMTVLCSRKFKNRGGCIVWDTEGIV